MSIENGMPEDENVTVSPFDPLEADVDRGLLVEVLSDIQGRCRQQLEEALVLPVPDEVSVSLRRRRWLQALEALAWARTQRSGSVRIGVFPVDYAAELEYFDKLLDTFPDEEDGDLDLPF